MKNLLVVLVAVLCCASPAIGAQTPRAKYVKSVSTIAPPDSAKPKGLCVCQNGVDQGQVGYLRQKVATGNALSVLCEMPAFDGDGQVIGGGICTTFVPLVK
jgi:hypothetical protein